MYNQDSSSFNDIRIGNGAKNANMETDNDENSDEIKAKKFE
jgi:hypothetical protein